MSKEIIELAVNDLCNPVVDPARSPYSPDALRIARILKDGACFLCKLSCHQSSLTSYGSRLR